MPHIEERHLLELHKTLDKSNEERDEFEIVFRNERKRNKKLKNERNLLMRLSSVSLLAIIIILALYFITPNLFIQQRYLKANGLALVKQKPLKENTKSLENKTTQNNELNIDNKDSLVSSIGNVISNQMVYVVQIAASEVELTSIFHRGLKGLKETQEDGYYKYSLGDFETLTEAQKYRRELLRIGFEDAFVASYKNNKRQKIEEAW